MKIKVFTIYDSVAQVYEQPFYAVNAGVAGRALVGAARNDPKSRFNTNGNEFLLYETAEYDDSTGMFDPLPTPLHIARVGDLVGANKES